MTYAETVKAASKVLLDGIEGETLRVLKALWTEYKAEINEVLDKQEYRRQMVAWGAYKGAIFTMHMLNLKTPMTLKNKIRAFLYAALSVTSF